MTISTYCKKLQNTLRRKFGYHVYSSEEEECVSMHSNNINGDIHFTFDVCHLCTSYYPNRVVAIEVYYNNSKNVKYMSLDEMITIGEIAKELKKEIEK